MLALLVLPTIIIASRAALKAVPPSIKEAALGVGASQAAGDLPSRAAAGDARHHDRHHHRHGACAGETAPLLMIGMVAFIVETPTCITDAATVLPVQIFLWSDLPEIGFQAERPRAIMVLLALPVRHERYGDHPAQTLRAALVGKLE